MTVSLHKTSDRCSKALTDAVFADGAGVKFVRFQHNTGWMEEILVAKFLLLGDDLGYVGAAAKEDLELIRSGINRALTSGVGELVVVTEHPPSAKPADAPAGPYMTVAHLRVTQETTERGMLPASEWARIAYPDADAFGQFMAWAQQREAERVWEIKDRLARERRRARERAMERRAVARAAGGAGRV
ncbi:hypothetical protein AB0O47_39120 [Streptomyces noursei]|uniref:hypothetical protein n=1 Tax=Streptomyces noursei TaxID=1971 RepID=UPI00345047A2